MVRKANAFRRKLVLGVAFLLCLSGLVVWLMPPAPSEKADSREPAPRVLQSALGAGAGEIPRPPPAGSGSTNSFVQKAFAYGSGPGDVGMIKEPDQTPIGPESFSVGADGSILVADRVNQRVLVCDKDGEPVRSVRFPGVNLNEVFSDRGGNLFVWDQKQHVLHLADSAGRIASTLRLDPADIDTRGYFHAAGDAVYFADAAARDVLVAEIKDGQISAPLAESARRTDGIHSNSGRIYRAEAVKGRSFELEARDARTSAVLYSFRLDLPDLLSVRYAGEDGRGRCHLAVERLIEGKVRLEVRTISGSGEMLSTIPLPDNDYFIWTSKLVEAAPDGTIAQFVPAEERARLNLIRP